MKVTDAELAAVYRAEAAHTKHKQWAKTLLKWAERLAPSQIELFESSYKLTGT